MIGVERNPHVFSAGLGLLQDRPGHGSGAKTHPDIEFPHGLDLGQRDHSIDHRVPEQRGALGNALRMAGSCSCAFMCPQAFDLLVDQGSELVEQVEWDGVGDDGGSVLSQLLDVAPQIELIDARPQ